MKPFCTLLVILSVLSLSMSAFVSPQNSFRSSDQMKLRGFMDAFKNDESLGKPQNAGLTNGPRTNDNVSVNGKAVKAVVGQKVSDVAAAARAKINYDCRNGDCGTCRVNINGRVVKACQQRIPTGKCVINTL